MAQTEKNVWVNPQTLLRFHHEKLGPLEVVREQDGAEPQVHRLKLISAKNSDEPFSYVVYQPHPPSNGGIYVRNVETVNEHAKQGMSSSLLALLSAMEQKKLFLFPFKLAKRKKVYEKIGFKNDVVPWEKKIESCLSLDSTSQLRPQKWVVQAAKKWNAEHPQESPKKATRKFFIRKGPSQQ
jgi:hypothetical protein